MESKTDNDNKVIVASLRRVAFGQEMREKHFPFAQEHRPLNHGSFGTFPKEVLKYQQRLQNENEARPDLFMRYKYRSLLKESRSAVAPLLGVDPGEVVFIPNVTTGVNTVLRNIDFEEGDVVLHFNTIHPGGRKTIESLEETGPVKSHRIDVTYPIEDDAILDYFESAIQEVEGKGKRAKVAIFDTILTSPGVRFPWERLVGVCRNKGIISLIDAAHGIGHIDLTHLGTVGPDFMISNCYKWMMVPRGCAILYVPFRNQRLIRTTYPTSWGYERPAERAELEPNIYFLRLFEKVSTTDNTPYMCVPVALKFRSEVCGGEASIRNYCEDIARRGGKLMANILGTEVLETKSGTAQQCCFTNIRLPLTLSELGVTESEGRTVATWIQEKMPAEHDTFIPTRFYAGGFWSRVSGQIYLTLNDFEWAAKILLELCRRAKAGEWKSA